MTVNRRSLLTGTAAAFGWSRRDPRPGSMQDGDRLVGMGCATSLYPTNMAATAARVRIALGVAVRVRTATHETGPGVTVVLALMVSEALGVPLERITVELGDSTLPPSLVAGGSNNTASLCAVVARACEDIRSRIAGAAVTAEDGPFRGADPASPQLAADALHGPDGAASRHPRARPPRAWQQQNAGCRRVSCSRTRLLPGGCRADAANPCRPHDGAGAVTGGTGGAT